MTYDKEFVAEALYVWGQRQRELTQRDIHIEYAQEVANQDVETVSKEVVADVHRGAAWTRRTNDSRRGKSHDEIIKVYERMSGAGGDDKKGDQHQEAEMHQSTDT